MFCKKMHLKLFLKAAADKVLIPNNNDHKYWIFQSIIINHVNVMFLFVVLEAQ